MITEEDGIDKLLATRIFVSINYLLLLSWKWGTDKRLATICIDGALINKRRRGIDELFALSRRWILINYLLSSEDGYWWTTCSQQKIGIDELLAISWSWVLINYLLSVEYGWLINNRRWGIDKLYNYLLSAEDEVLIKYLLSAEDEVLINYLLSAEDGVKW